MIRIFAVLALFICTAWVKSPVSSPAHSPVFSPVQTEVSTPSEGGGGEPALGYTPMDEVVSTALVDIDFTVEDSYDGSSQTVTNITSSGTTYDFWLGSSSSSEAIDPTFNGTAGDAAAYLETDGADYITAQTSAAPCFAKGHRTDQAGVWYAFAGKTASSNSATRSIFGNSSSAGTAGSRALGLWGSDFKIDYYISNGSSNLTVTDTSTALSNDLDFIYIVSFDGTSTTNNFKAWMNTTTAITKSATLNASTADSANTFTIFAANTFSPVQSGFRLYAFACGLGELLTDAKATLIMEEYASRHTEGRYSFLP